MEEQAHHLTCWLEGEVKQRSELKKRFLQKHQLKRFVIF